MNTITADPILKNQESRFDNTDKSVILEAKPKEIGKISNITRDQILSTLHRNRKLFDKKYDIKQKSLYVKILASEGFINEPQKKELLANIKDIKSIDLKDYIVSNDKDFDKKVSKLISTIKNFSSNINNKKYFNKSKLKKYLDNLVQYGYLEEYQIKPILKCKPKDRSKILIESIVFTTNPKLKLYTENIDNSLLKENLCISKDSVFQVSDEMKKNIDYINSDTGKNDNINKHFIKIANIQQYIKDLDSTKNISDKKAFLQKQEELGYIPKHFIEQLKNIDFSLNDIKILIKKTVLKESIESFWDEKLKLVTNAVNREHPSFGVRIKDIETVITVLTQAEKNANQGSIKAEKTLIAITDQLILSGILAPESLPIGDNRDKGIKDYTSNLIRSLKKERKKSLDILADQVNNRQRDLEEGNETNYLYSVCELFCNIKSAGDFKLVKERLKGLLSKSTNSFKSIVDIDNLDRNDIKILGLMTTHLLKNKDIVFHNTYKGPNPIISTIQNMVSKITDSNTGKTLVLAFLIGALVCPTALAKEASNDKGDETDQTNKTNDKNEPPMEVDSIKEKDSGPNFNAGADNNKYDPLVDNTEDIDPENIDKNEEDKPNNLQTAIVDLNIVDQKEVIPNNLQTAIVDLNIVDQKEVIPNNLQTAIVDLNIVDQKEVIPNNLQTAIVDLNIVDQKEVIPNNLQTAIVDLNIVDQKEVIPNNLQTAIVDLNIVDQKEVIPNNLQTAIVDLNIVDQKEVIPNNLQTAIVDLNIVDQKEDIPNNLQTAIVDLNIVDQKEDIPNNLQTAIVDLNIVDQKEDIPNNLQTAIVDLNIVDQKEDIPNNLQTAIVDLNIVDQKEDIPNNLQTAIVDLNIVDQKEDIPHITKEPTVTVKRQKIPIDLGKNRDKNLSAEIDPKYKTEETPTNDTTPTNNKEDQLLINKLKENGGIDNLGEDGIAVVEKGSEGSGYPIKLNTPDEATPNNKYAQDTLNKILNKEENIAKPTKEIIEEKIGGKDEYLKSDSICNNDANFKEELDILNPKKDSTVNIKPSERFESKRMSNNDSNYDEEINMF